MSLQMLMMRLDTDVDDYYDSRPVFTRKEPHRFVHREALIQKTGNLFITQAEHDMEIALNAASKLSLGEQDQQGYMTQSTQLHDFLSSTCSNAVLIQGNSPYHDAATSVYAASLVIALQQLSVPVMHFNCGLHKTPYRDDPFLGPDGIMLALLQQYLESYPLDNLAFLERDVLRYQFQDIQSIGHIMHILVSNEPRTSTTFYIIDGISFFENSACEVGTRQAIYELCELVARASGCFKLLFTSPTRSMYVPQYLANGPAPYEILHVPSQIVHGRHQGVAPSTLIRSVSDNIVQINRILPY